MNPKNEDSRLLPVRDERFASFDPPGATRSRVSMAGQALPGSPSGRTGPLRWDDDHQSDDIDQTGRRIDQGDRPHSVFAHFVTTVS